MQISHKQDKIGELIGKISLVLIGESVAKILGLLFLVVAARKLETANFGRLKYALEIAFTGMVVVQGPITTLIRFVALHKESSLSRSYLMNAVVLIITSLGITGLVVYGIGGWLKFSAEGIFMVIIANACFQSVYGLAKAVGKPILMVYCYNLMNGSQLLAAVIYYFFSSQSSVWAFLLFFALSSMLSAATFSRLLIAKLPYGKPQFSFVILRKLFNFSVKLLMAELGYIVWAGLDTILVMHRLGPTASGIFGVARTMVMPFLMVSAASSSIVLPYFSVKRPHSSRRQLLQLMGIILILSLGGILIYWIFGPWIVAAFFSSAYATAAPLLPGLAMGMAVFALYTVLTSYTTAIGLPWVFAISIIAGAIVEIIMAFPLLNMFGLKGASYCSLVGSLTALFVTAAIFLFQRSREGMLNA